MVQSIHVERQWIFQDTPIVPAQLREGLPYPDFILETLVRRGFSDLSSARRFLNPSQYQPSSPLELPDMAKGIERISNAIDHGEQIGIWGDFDVDGQTSTAILVEALRQLGARHIYHIPVRGRETHGIGLDALKEFISQEVSVILTCDTGVTANTSIVYAKSRGIDTVITDHHLLPESLPEAFALINPRRLPIGHPLSSLPGAGTAFKFAEALMAARGSLFNPDNLHDLVALGIIADLADLTGDNRYLVQSGLSLLRTSARPSLSAILEAAEIRLETLTEEQVSFTLAPRLNAVGRLSDANPIVNFLLSKDPAEIAVTVNQVEGLNSRRKILCDQVFSGAQSLIEQNRSLLDHPVLVLHHQEWPGGVVGIVASRLVEIYHRPVILLTGNPGQPLHGSARSVEGIDVTSALRTNEALLINYGGHPMAAGLSLHDENLSAFRRGIDNVISAKVGDSVSGSPLLIDHVLQPSAVTYNLAQSLELLSPYGPGNPALNFAAKDLEISSSKPVGKFQEHRLVEIEETSGDISRLIWWNGNGLPMPEGRFELAYTPRVTNYRGEDQVSLEWIEYRQANDAIILSKSKRVLIQNIDLRTSSDPYTEYQGISQLSDLLVWKEGTDNYPLSGLSRSSLKPCKHLVIWSTPVNIEVLTRVLHVTRPEYVYWYLISPHQQDPSLFLRQLAKWIKTELKEDSTTLSISSMAEMLATSNHFIHLGINWLAARGAITILDVTPDTYTLLPGGRSDKGKLTEIEEAFSRSFRELQSFLEYLRQADLDRITDDLR